MRPAAGLACLLLATACASETSNTSGPGAGTTETSLLLEPGFRTVLRIDMRRGTSGEDSSALSQKYFKFSGVESARGGDGETLIIFKPEATEGVVLGGAGTDEGTTTEFTIEPRR